ncbi:MAG: family 10 glycosylhydrolase [Moorea sp. SIO2B7]|nr:family 10 glycosylhydrolase [Moorena sp. SIO2B7]
MNHTLKQHFIDASAIPKYAKNAVVAALNNKLIVNYPNVRQLKPNKLATRGEVAASVCQALKSTQVIPSEYIANSSSKTNSSAELRGVWLTNIDSDVLFSKQNLANGIESLAKLNFNTLYPTVWNWGYTLYPSQVAKQVTGQEIDPEEGLQERDILKEIVEQGHEKGMAVIPWFEFGFMAPADSELAKRHPNWLTERQNGDTIWLEGKVHKRVWLNPLHPEVQKFITDLVVEIVSKYNVDGIQFDDHFGFPSEFGYDKYTASLYQQEHDGKYPPKDYQDEKWIRWRADKITDYMKQLFQAIKSSKSRAIVSVSPNPQEFSLESYLLDWHKWERMGLIEELVLQVYRTDLNKFIEELQQPEVEAARQHIPVSIGILSGIKPRFVPLENITTQVQTVRNNEFAGVSFFFYESLWNLAKEPPEQRQSTFKEMFPTTVQTPNIYNSWMPKDNG